MLDTRSRTLVRDGNAVPLTPKAFQLLERLVERRPAVVSQGELRDLLWPGTHVGHTSLARLVTELRQAVGDEAGEARFIRTLRGFGYSFIGSADDRGPAPTAAAYRLSGARGETDLYEGENLIGRDSECRVRIVSDRTSRRHARITISGGKAILEDLGSKNGTRHEGRPIAGAVELRDGDEIMVGHELLVFTSAVSQRTTRTGAVSD